MKNRIYSGQALEGLRSFQSTVPDGAVHHHRPVRGAGRVDGLTRDKLVRMFKECFNEIASTMAAWCITRLSLFLVTDHPKNSHLALHCSSAIQSQKAVYDYFTSKQILPFVFAEQSLHYTYHISISMLKLLLLISQQCESCATMRFCLDTWA